jgi:hypothetical protein
MLAIASQATICRHLNVSTLFVQHEHFAGLSSTSQWVSMQGQQLANHSAGP